MGMALLVALALAPCFALADFTGAKTARVIDTGRDRYGRTLGYVLCDGVDANAEQIHRGMA